MPTSNDSFSEIIIGDRHCESGWFISQSDSIIRIAKKHKARNALVYAALEARNSVEQIWFNLIVACRGGKITKTLVNECRKTDGIFRVMRETEPDYRKLVRFTQICSSIDVLMPKVIAWDLKKLKRYWNELSIYCHSPMTPVDTLDSPEWFDKGISLVSDVCDYVISQMRNAHGTGIINPKTMPPEVERAWESFKSDSLSEKDLGLRLEIMLPVLRSRLR